MIQMQIRKIFYFNILTQHLNCLQYGSIHAVNLYLGLKWFLFSFKAFSFLLTHQLEKEAMSSIFQGPVYEKPLSAVQLTFL